MAALERRVLARVNGRRNVGEIARELGVPLEVAADALPAARDGLSQRLALLARTTVMFHDAAQAGRDEPVLLSELSFSAASSSSTSFSSFASRRARSLAAARSAAPSSFGFVAFGAGALLRFDFGGFGSSASSLPNRASSIFSPRLEAAATAASFPFSMAASAARSAAFCFSSLFFFPSFSEIDFSRDTRPSVPEADFRGISASANKFARLRVPLCMWSSRLFAALACSVLLSACAGKDASAPLPDSPSPKLGAPKASTPSHPAVAPYSLALLVDCSGSCRVLP